MVIPNCVRVPAACPARDANARNVLFVGGLIHSNQSPNVDAVRWFIANVWPGIVAAEPSVQFHVVGEVKASLEKILRETPNVVVRGYVDDLADAYHHAAFSIAPIRYGTGTRLKILESMAFGCPVVSSTKGWEGLELSPSKHLLVADSPKEWINSCLELLRTPDRQQTLARDAFQVVRRLYDVDARRPWLADVLTKAIADARAIPVSSTSQSAH